jgi:hypothetical protein
LKVKLDIFSLFDEVNMLKLLISNSLYDL